MTITNHWGIYVDSEVPTTGVHSIHDVAWEWFDYNDELCLDCERTLSIIADEIGVDSDNLDAWDAFDSVECDSSHTKLIGDWIQGEDGKYEPDKNGEYSAIENETTIQVVWSKYTERHGLCSPCYPGQADVDSKGEFLCYVLPPELRYKK